MDLQRVKRLALGSSAHVVRSDHGESIHEISSLLQLFTGVEELFLEQWGQRLHDMLGTCMHPDDSNLWCHTPPLEVDILATSFLRHYSFSSTAFMYDDWKAYKADNMADGNRFFIDAARKFKEKLALRRDELVLRRSFVPWKIPEISIVLIASASRCRRLFEWRWAAWNGFRAMRENQARSEALKEARRSIDVPRRLIYEHEGRPPSPFSERLQDDEEAFQALQGRESYGYDDTPEIHTWIMAETIAAPDGGMVI